MNKSTGILLAMTCLFAGMVIGFLTAPVKEGISIGNNTGNTVLPAGGEKHA